MKLSFFYEKNVMKLFTLMMREDRNLLVYSMELGCDADSSDMALVYNDRAVLENYHVSAVFKLFRDDDYNILSGLRTDEFR